MAKQFYSVLTSYGAQALANALANRQPLNIVQMAVGDGNGRAVTPDSNRTSLVREVHRANISAISQDPRNNKQVIFELTIPENVGGFYIREMGIFDQNNRMIAYSNCPESFKPRLDSGSGKVQVMRMVLLVSSSDAITLQVDNSVIFVTRQQLKPLQITAQSANSFNEEGHSHAIDIASLIKAGIVRLSNELDSDDETKAPTLKAIKILKAFIDSNTRSLGNYIANSKKSSAVNSNSEDSVATSKAVKTAYDKAVDAKNAADNANNNANGRVSKSGDSMDGTLTVTGRQNGGFAHGVRLINYGGGFGAGGYIDYYAAQDRIAQASLHFTDRGGHAVGASVLTTPAGHNFDSDRRETHTNFDPNGTLWVKGYGWLHEKFHHAGKDYLQVNAADNNYGGLEIVQPNNHNARFRVESEGDHFKFWHEGNGKNYSIYAPERSGTLALEEDVLRREERNGFTILKFPDGTMIQTYRFVPPNERMGAQLVKFSFNWAVSFVHTPKIWWQHINMDNASLGGSLDTAITIENASTNNSRVVFVAWEAHFNNYLSQFDFFAIGRWK